MPAAAPGGTFAQQRGRQHGAPCYIRASRPRVSSLADANVRGR